MEPGSLFACWSSHNTFRKGAGVSESAGQLREQPGRGGASTEARQHRPREETWASLISRQGFDVVVLMIIKVILATCKEFTGREQEEAQGGHAEDCDVPPSRDDAPETTAGMGGAQQQVNLKCIWG